MKHRLLIELLYSTGLRLSECINLKYSDLDLVRNVAVMFPELDLKKLDKSRKWLVLQT